MKRLIMIALIYANMLIWSDAHAVERDYLGIPTKSNIPAYIAAGLIMADWSQTRQIAGRNDLLEENKNLGSQPDMGQVNRYFFMKLTAHVLVNTFKPVRKLKNIWNIYQIGITFIAVKGNYDLGLKVRF